jgi:hypothetical protein
MFCVRHLPCVDAPDRAFGATSWKHWGMRKGLVLQSLSFDSDTDVRLSFVAPDGSLSEFLFATKTVDGITVVSASSEFASLYRQVPGPRTPTWPEALVLAA